MDAHGGTSHMTFHPIARFLITFTYGGVMVPGKLCTTSYAHSSASPKVVTLNRVPALLIAKVSRRPNSVVSVGMMLAKRSRAASTIFWETPWDSCSFLLSTPLLFKIVMERNWSWKKREGAFRISNISGLTVDTPENSYHGCKPLAIGR